MPKSKTSTTAGKVTRAQILERIEREKVKFMRGELPQHQLVGFCELADGVAQQIQGADDASLAAQRHDQLGIRSGNGFDVARIGVHIVDQNRPSLGNRGADQTVSDFQFEPAGIFRIANRVGQRELFAFVVEQVRRKRVELGEPCDQLRNFLQQFVEIEHRRDFTSEFEQCDDKLTNVRGRRSRSNGWFSQE